MRTTDRNALISAILAFPALAIGNPNQIPNDCEECYTQVKPYAVSVSPQYTIQPLLSVSERVPETSDPAKEYQMIGIPDGLGAHSGRRGTTVLYMNHELVQTALSEPVVGGPINRGAIVSKWTLDKNACVLSGERAYDTVYKENVLVGPAAEVGNATPAFARFCSGSLAWYEAGFDRPIYLTGEESGGAATFDGMGGLTVAIFDNEVHTIPKFGRFAWENTLARPKFCRETVLIGMEDGPSTPDSQLYMYVGFKDRSPGATAMRRNGLDNGKLYVLVPKGSVAER